MEKIKYQARIQAIINAKVQAQSTASALNVKLKRIVKSLIKLIYGEIMNKNKYFKFYLTKNGNTKIIKKETETI